MISLSLIQFGSTTNKLAEKLGKTLCNMKIISKQKEFTHELPGVVSEDGKNATIHGSLGVYMIMWVTEEEAELICKLIRIKMDWQTG